MNAKGELLIRHTAIARLGSVHGRVDLEPNIEQLSGKEVGLVRREDASESGASSKTLVRLSIDSVKEEGEEHEGTESRELGRWGHFAMEGRGTVPWEY